MVQQSRMISYIRKKAWYLALCLQHLLKTNSYCAVLPSRICRTWANGKKNIYFFFLVFFGHTLYYADNIIILCIVVSFPSNKQLTMRALFFNINVNMEESHHCNILIKRQNLSFDKFEIFLRSPHFGSLLLFCQTTRDCQRCHVTRPNAIATRGRGTSLAAKGSWHWLPAMTGPILGPRAENWAWQLTCWVCVYNFIIYAVYPCLLTKKMQRADQRQPLRRLDRATKTGPVTLMIFKRRPISLGAVHNSPASLPSSPRR